MPTKRAWRKVLKKQQRKRRRQKNAQEREMENELEQCRKEKTAEYQEWLKQQTEMEEFQRLTEERIKQDEEREWLRREALAQSQFHLELAKLRQQEAELERIREQQAKELEALQEQKRLRREEKAKLAEKAAAEFEEMMQRMQEYMEDSENRSPPVELRRVVDTHPEQRLCEFFTRTNSCRYGHVCTFNHRRPMLAKILLIRHFFTHPLLQEIATNTEYATADEHLELTESDLQDDYDEFFQDVVVELEKFGKIINFRAVRNTLPHLRGHVFVEYAKERFALRAFINLQGRFYASRRLNVEFANVTAWRGAICGLSLTRKCPKGYRCGFIHLFQNPNNLLNEHLGSYNKPSSVPSSAPSSQNSTTPRVQIESWNDIGKETRNWRWSESPEPELDTSRTQSSSSHHDEDRLSKCKQDTRQSCSDSKSSQRSTRQSESSETKVQTSKTQNTKDVPTSPKRNKYQCDRQSRSKRRRCRGSKSPETKVQSAKTRSSRDVHTRTRQDKDQSIGGSTPQSIKSQTQSSKTQSSRDGYTKPRQDKDQSSKGSTPQSLESQTLSSKTQSSRDVHAKQDNMPRKNHSSSESRSNESRRSSESSQDRTPDPSLSPAQHRHRIN